MIPVLLRLNGAPGNVWHEPAYAHPDLGGPTMRDPLYEAADHDLTIYQGFFKSGGANGNQTGGELVYRTVPRTGTPSVWTSVPLGFHADVGVDQYWKATLPSAALPATDVIEYYLRIEFDDSGSDPDITYLYGGDLKDNFLVTTDEITARGNPYSIRNRTGWIYHAGNSAVAEDDIQLEVRTGYIGPDNDPDTRWADSGAVYFTTDGSEPEGSLGTPSGSSFATPLIFNGSARNNSGNGNEAVWRATLENVLDGLPLGEEVRYKIGFWNTANNEEKFADHAAGPENNTFVYQNGELGEPELTVNGLNANYTTTKLFVDEVVQESVDLNIVFAPGEANVTVAEVYTNLNRRDRADEDADNDGYPDGVSGLDGNLLASGDDSHYYKAHPMTDQGAGTWTLTLPANKTGAYRLTARWKVDGDPNWRWYTNQVANRRDHAITVSPRDARDIVLYEINVLNIEATGDTFGQRSTIEDMHNAPGAPHNGNDRWNLDYLKALGANWLWFQPIHPTARDGREPNGGWDTPTPPYEPGSPYAVKNFFEVNPIMTKDFTGDPTNGADLLSQANRDAAMAAWAAFVADADAKEVGIMLDAPFNHTAFDVELGEIGMQLFEPDDATWSPTDEIRDRERRFFSREGNYGERAGPSTNIAAGPDRFDFGKWRDVKDVFFGVYDALVEVDSEPERSSYTNEGDWFDFDHPTWTANDFQQNNVDRNVTRLVWTYFANYALHWLTETGYPQGTPHTEATRHLGIDGLRCDFGQGLPPRAWEYIINVARERKWNFVMMSESLDGGAVTYRSNRHFDILNENIVFPLKSAGSDDDYRNIFEGRRDAYGQGLVLINNVSHDEENYSDPWQALIRYSVASTMDGVPMIFPGQELGISTTFGYNHYEVNFGKTIPHFKRYNSMQPIWNDADYGNDQLYAVYAGMGAARLFSPALRSSNRWFMDGEGNNGQIHAVAKYQTPNASPAGSDVVIGLANLDRDNTQSDQFKLPPALADLMGIEDDRTYNVKNIAAYTAQDPNRRDQWLWNGTSGFTGSELETNGFFVQLNPVPTTGDDPGTAENEAAQAWAAAPFEAQYLKVYDITAPIARPDQPDNPEPYAYALGETVVFDWADVAADDAGVVPHYEVTITVNGSPVEPEVVSDSTYSHTASYGDEVSITVKAVNPDVNANAGPVSVASPTVKLLDRTADEDQDGQSNEDEDAAGTNPRDSASVFKMLNPVMNANGDPVLTWTVVSGKTYEIQATSDLTANDWEDNVLASGLTTDTFTDTSGIFPRYYRVVVMP
jgi:glycosidase